MEATRLQHHGDDAVRCVALHSPSDAVLCRELPHIRVVGVLVVKLGLFERLERDVAFGDTVGDRLGAVVGDGRGGPWAGRRRRRRRLGDGRRRRGRGRRGRRSGREAEEVTINAEVVAPRAVVAKRLCILRPVGPDEPRVVFGVKLVHPVARDGEGELGVAVAAREGGVDQVLLRVD
eukprot:6176872-Pleurochrysis_carterae.AAC.2